MAAPATGSSHVRIGDDRGTGGRSTAETTYGRLRRVISGPKWLVLEPLIAGIERLDPAAGHIQRRVD